MASFLDVCRFTPTLGGTTDWTVSAAVTGYQTPVGAGAVDGAIYRYRAESADLSQWEVGYGAYTVAGTVLARTTVLFNSAGTTAKISFSAAPQVAIVALAEDLIFINPPQGRLTLQTGTPVMSTTQSAKTTLFYAPYVGRQVPIYDGTSWRNANFTELSAATTDTTKSPAAIGASKVNDWFVWDDAGTLRVGHGPDWTNDTTRSAGAALVVVNGISLNSVAITNGPAASRGTWVGTTRSNASSQLDWILGSAAAGGGMASLYVWNAYNQVLVATSVLDNTASWTYLTATIRAANNSAANRVNFVSGAPTHSIVVAYNVMIRPAATASALGEAGVCLDATSAADVIARVTNPSTGTMDLNVSPSYAYAPQLGAHFVSAVEKGDGSTTATYFGLSTVQRQALAFSTMM